MNKTPSALKRLVFNATLILIPLLFLIVLESALRLFHCGTDLSLFIRSPRYHGYYEINPFIGKRYFSKLEAPAVSNDVFLIKKPDTCYRIFVMGESTAEGFPFQPGMMFSRILQCRLQDAFPHKRIEVVNTGVTAVCSYTMADFIDEILQQRPDALIIYAGHNEYYGALGIASVENGGNARWIKKLHLKLVRLRTYQVMQQLVRWSTGLIARKTPFIPATLMERIAKGKSILYGSAGYSAGIDQFRANMAEIIQKARRAGVRTMVSEQVCNIRDLPPFESIETPGIPGAARFYEKAKHLDSAGDFEGACSNYYTAKDYDVIRFRAPEAINGVIADLGKAYGVSVVPMRRYFEEHSPHGLIGYNLITEHLHPNADGYFLMADVFFNSLRSEKFIAGEWDSLCIKTPEYYRNHWGFTRIDSLAAALRIGQVTSGWPFKPAGTKNTFFESYRPASFEDSLLFDAVVYQKGAVENVHIDAAKRCALRGDNMGAFREYYSLIKSYPYTTSLYFDALKYLSAAGDDSTALALLLSMPNLGDSYRALFTAGLICLKLNMPERAAEHFIRARPLLKPGDSAEPLLNALYVSYHKLGDSGNAARVAAELHSIDPGFTPGEMQVRVEIPIPPDVKSLIEDAVAEENRGNADKALALLDRSLAIRETGLADRIIGTIYFERNDRRALTFLERAYRKNTVDPDLMIHLFVLYLRGNNLDEASQCLDRYRHLGADAGKAEMMRVLLEKARHAAAGKNGHEN